jgi:hypothetical protein
MSAAVQAWARPASVSGDADRLLSTGLCVLIVAVALCAYFMDSPWLVWLDFLPALWLASHSPQKLAALMALTIPIFPVLRVAEDALGAQQVSTRGLFFSVDDPMIAAWAAAWILRRLTQRGAAVGLFPTSLAGLAVVYPCAIAVNAMRLEQNETLVSSLYYAKWLEYALLVYLIPAVVPARRVPELLRLMRGALWAGILLSAGFAVYEVAESVRTGAYTAAARFPRASAFFGSLERERFGASEDPVNFGCYLAVAGAIALSYSARVRRTGASSAAAAASLVGVLLSVSRTPVLAAGVAFARIQRLRSGRVLLAAAGLAAVGLAVSALFPQAGTALAARFESIVEPGAGVETSASDRLRIALNSPVFDIDAFWLVGHGHSSYRFIAEQHLAQFTRGVSRSLYNFPLTIWYDAGAIGLALWVLLFVQLNRRFGEMAHRSAMPELRALSDGLRAALWGLALASMFGEIPYNWRVMGFFYTCAGACLAAGAYDRALARGLSRAPRRA